MLNARWHQVERIYLAALERGPDTRDAFLTDACAGDTALRDEVRSLLGFADATTGFLDRPALSAAVRDFAPDAHATLVGRQIDGYEVTSLLGAGGMGEVYRARDLRLRRDLALKILSPLLVGSASDLRRFEEEARSACVLNHPNIVTIYGVGEVDAVAYIAMELVQGQTLREVMSGRTLPLQSCLDLAVQLADALAAAHERGIVHRDLKPDNVMVTTEGLLKVLDFGIAKRSIAEEVTGTAHLRPSPVGPSTERGAILGTAGYMSPEQATGRPTQVQSDQFSFGVILYEMLTGQRPFEGRTRAETLAAVVHARQIPITELSADQESSLRPLIDRCLEKDPSARYPTTRDLALELRAARDACVAQERSAGLTRRQAIWLGAAASAAAIAGLATWRVWRAARARKLAILPFANPLKDDGTEYLSDGIARVLIRQLSGVPTLSLMAAGTVFTFKGREVDPRAVGRQLDVHAVLSGAVTRELGRVKISAELVDVDSGVRLWGQEYDRLAADVLAVQDEIARAIIGDGLQLSEAERRLLPPGPTTNADAFEAYLEGLHYLRLQSERGYLAARIMLEQALALDPRFALACATLASTYSTMAVDGYVRPSEAWPLQRQFATRSLELDPELPEGKVEALTASFFYDRNWVVAEQGWTAILRSRRNVGQPDLLGHLALLKWSLRRPDAVQTARVARATDPLNPTFAVREADLLLLGGQTGPAADLYQTVTGYAPEDSRAYFGLAEARRRQQRYAEAIEVRRRAEELRDDEPMAATHPLASLFAKARGEAGYEQIERESARLQLEALDRRVVAGEYASPLDYARAYALRNDATRAFQALDAAFVDGAAGLVFLNVDPAWTSIRSDPRFATAVRRAGLTADRT